MSAESRRLIRIAVIVNLCPECRFGNRCPGMQVAESAGGGVTCLRYTPRKPRGLPPAHILALPDREPCADCACRKGSQPNGTHHSMADFEQCVADGSPFLCHADGANRICAGWLRAAKARATPPTR
jgi:hypothetical protein